MSPAPTTISMEYHPLPIVGNISRNTTPIYPYAVTHHYDSQHPTNFINTTVIYDGFGRTMQIKKDAEYNGNEASLVSGKIVYDCFGRTIKQYHPYLEDLDSSIYFTNNFVDSTLSQTWFDILDRQILVRLPDGTQTSYLYGFDHVDGRSCFRHSVIDANGNMVTSLLGSRQQTLRSIAPGNIVTSFEYDPLGRTTRTTDPDGLTTFYYYDRLGRLVAREHPDAGIDSYYYDLAGNMTKHVNGIGQEINYYYQYNQLTDIKYPANPANNVHYVYGDSGAVNNRAGRIMLQEDASGWQLFSYGKLGEITENIRTFVPPYEMTPYTFKMNFEYDSYNRIQRIVYPDSEEVNYHYNLGGMLDSIGGRKGSIQYAYVKNIFYNPFELKESVVYGNGSTTQYFYDVLQRLSTLVSKDGQDNYMQYIRYSYDSVGNITSIANSADTLANSMGGHYKYQYTYDNLYRLIQSEGSWYGSFGQRDYSVRMSYLPNGRISGKFVRAVTTEYPGTAVTVGYNNRYDYYSGTNKLDQTFDSLMTRKQLFYWSETGNLESQDKGTTECTRNYCWDEENRLTASLDCHFSSYYQYDATGERTYKFTGKNLQQGINGGIHNYSFLASPTLYASPYVVCTSKGYTKHYYAENERVASRIGIGGLKDIKQFLNVDCDFNLNDTSDNQYLTQYDTNKILYNKIECNNSQLHYAMSCLHEMQVDCAKENLLLLYKLEDYVSAEEKDCYWYHPDHLGSTSWITHTNGKAVQHLQYLPWGEDFVDQRSTNWNAMHAFSAKEKDVETGLSYFGSRYYSSELSLWLSVDPMADKYPHLSPFTFCANTPVRCADPNGEEVYEFDESGKYLGVSGEKDCLNTYYEISFERHRSGPHFHSRTFSALS